MSPLRVPVLGVFDFVRSNSRRPPALATCQGRTCLHAPRPLLSPESSPPRQLTQRGSCARSALKRRRRRDMGRPGWRRPACNGRRELTRREPPPSTESCETAKGEPRSARANVLRVLAVTHKQRVQYKCTARKSWCTCAAFRDTTLPIFSRHCLDGYLLANPACLSSLRLRGAFTRDV